MPPAGPDKSARPQKTAAPPSGISLGELVSAEVVGLQVFLDTLRYDPESNQIWLLSISGQSTAVRGAWANLTGFHSYLKVLPSQQLLTLASGGLGWRTRSARLGDPKRLGRSWEHMVLLPPCTETWAHIGEMLIVDRPDRDHAGSLMNLLAIRSSLPLDSRWRDEVWAWAVEAGATSELAGHGPAAWLVRLNDKLLIDEFLPRFARVEPAADLATSEVAA